MAHSHAIVNFKEEPLIDSHAEFESIPKLNRSEFHHKKCSKIGQRPCSRLVKRLESSDGRYDTAYQLALNIKAGTFEFMSEDEI